MKPSVAERHPEQAPVGGAKVEMAYASCVVRLGGDVRNEVPRASVSMPEIAILRMIHGGPETVVQIKQTGTRLVSPSAEKARLIALYGKREDYGQRIESLFPGFRPLFPLTLAEIEAMANPEQVDEDEMQEAAKDILS